MPEGVVVALEAVQVEEQEKMGLGWSRLEEALQTVKHRVPVAEAGERIS